MRQDLKRKTATASATACIWHAVLGWDLVLARDSGITTQCLLSPIDSLSSSVQGKSGCIEVGPRGANVVKDTVSRWNGYFNGGIVAGLGSNTSRQEGQSCNDFKHFHVDRSQWSFCRWDTIPVPKSYVQHLAIYALFDLCHERTPNTTKFLAGFLFYIFKVWWYHVELFLTPATPTIDPHSCKKIPNTTSFTKSAWAQDFRFRPRVFY